jgi:hypothetical protein
MLVKELLKIVPDSAFVEIRQHPIKEIDSLSSDDVVRQVGECNVLRASNQNYLEYPIDFTYARTEDATLVIVCECPENKKQSVIDAHRGRLTRK